MDELNNILLLLILIKLWSNEKKWKCKCNKPNKDSEVDDNGKE